MAGTKASAQGGSRVKGIADLSKPTGNRDRNTRGPQTTEKRIFPAGNMRRCGTIGKLTGWNLLEGMNEENVAESSTATWATGASREERFRRRQRSPEEVEEDTDKLTDRLNG